MEMQQTESQKYANSNDQACTNNSPKTKQGHVETRIKNHFFWPKQDKKTGLSKYKRQTNQQHHTTRDSRKNKIIPSLCKYWQTKSI